MQILIIIAVGVIYLHDGMRADGGGHALFAQFIPHEVALILQLVSITGVLAMHWLGTLLCIRMLDRRGLVSALEWSERLTIGSHIALVIVHVAGVLIFGWMEALRSWLPYIPGLCEIAALLPLFMGLIGTWLTNYPIEVRWFNAMLTRRMDDGTPIHAMPSRFTFALGRFRHGILLLALPMLLIMAWSRLLDQLAISNPAPEWVWPIARLSGVLLVVVCMPLILRVVWDTIPLEFGELRERLLGMCRRHGIGINNLLLWRTHGAMANGAVLGIIRPVRYILLTDRLLEMMNAREVEAVMAHEIAHIKHRHLLFLSMSSVGSILLVGTLSGWLLESIQGTLSLGSELLLTVGVLIVLASVFGYVSRRFEWQADAFAARHLSIELTDRGIAQPGIISANAVSIMIDALQSVADLNGILPTQFSFRHGSIHTRQHHLRQLVGLPIDRLPIDRTASRLKLLACIACICGIILAAVDVQRLRRADHDLQRSQTTHFHFVSTDAPHHASLHSCVHAISTCPSGETLK